MAVFNGKTFDRASKMFRLVGELAQIVPFSPSHSIHFPPLATDDRPI